MFLQGKAAEGLITTDEYIRHKNVMLQDATVEDEGEVWPEVTRMKLLFIQVNERVEPGALSLRLVLVWARKQETKFENCAVWFPGPSPSGVHLRVGLPQGQAAAPHAIGPAGR